MCCGGFTFSVLNFTIAVMVGDKFFSLYHVCQYVLWPLNCFLPYLCFPCGFGIEKIVGMGICKKKLSLSFQNCKLRINLICGSNDLKKLLDSKAKVIFFLPLQCILQQCEMVSASGKTLYIKVLACLNVPTFLEANEETASESFEHPSFHCEAHALLIPLH